MDCFYLIFISRILTYNQLRLVSLTLCRTSTILNIRGKKSVENIVGKGENYGNQHFLLFPQCFYPFKDKFHYFSHTKFVICSLFELDIPKIVSFSTELNCFVQQYSFVTLLDSFWFEFSAYTLNFVNMDIFCHVRLYMCYQMEHTLATRGLTHYQTTKF